MAPRMAPNSVLKTEQQLAGNSVHLKVSDSALQKAVHLAENLVCQWVYYLDSLRALRTVSAMALHLVWQKETPKD
jgi:hypothetical protein